MNLRLSERSGKFHAYSNEFFSRKADSGGGHESFVLLVSPDTHAVRAIQVFLLTR